MSLQNESLITEFDRFRFARQGNGALAELSSARRDERVFLVLDCLRYRFAQLHIFEEAAHENRRVNQFTRQMNTIGALNQPILPTLLKHGRDDSELFYVLGFTDGERMGDYLRRIGGLPEAAAIQTMLDLVELLVVTAPRPNALENFDLGHLMVTPDPGSKTGLRLHFTDLSGWNQPALENPAALVRRLALQLYNLLGGFVFRNPPSKLFVHEAQHASGKLQEFIATTLDETGKDLSLAAFASALRPLLNETETEYRAEQPPLPRRFLTQWLTENRGLPSIIPGQDFRHLDETDNEDELSFEAAPERSGPHHRLRFFLFPNWESIPREGWLEQHHSSLRRGARALPNQVGVAEIEPAGRCLLIGEEPIHGLSIRDLVKKRGPLEFKHTVALGRKISSALDVMEKTAGAAPVWWLPPRNVYVVTGNNEPDSLDARLEKLGTAAWQRLPVRLRLHQTANDLIEGLTFPESIMSRILRGGKQGETGRRTAVLLPLLWRLLTGETLDWERPLICPDEIEILEKAMELMETARRLIVEDPRRVHTSIVSQLESLAPVEEASDSGKTATFAEEEVETGGMVSEPVTLFDTGPVRPVAPASESNGNTATFDKSALKPGETYLSTRRRRRSLLPHPTTSRGEVENLGTIEDPLYARAASLAPATPKPKEGEIQSDESASQKSTGLSLTPFSAGARLEKPPEPEIAEKVEPAAPEEKPAPPRKSLFGFSRKSKPEAPKKTDVATASISKEPKEEEEAIDPDPQSGLPDEKPKEKEWFSGFEESARSEMTPGQKSESESSAASDSDSENAEPMSFFSFLSSQSVPADQSEATKLEAQKEPKPAEPDSKDSEPEKKPEPVESKSEEPKPVEATAPKSEAAPKDPEPEVENEKAAESKSPTARERIPQFIGAAALIWGVTYLLVSFAGTAERDTLAETFSPVVRTDYLKSALPFSASELSSDENETTIDEKSAAENPEAAARLADRYLPVDRKLGQEWLRRSAEFGHARHQRQLGLLLAEVPEQLPEAVSWLERAAAQDDIEASFYYGVALLRGRGVPPDPGDAIPFLEKAANAGDGRALDLLGVCFAEGTGCDVDERAAFLRFQQAVNAGNIEACYNLAVRFAKGLGTNRSEARAAEIFRMGAEQGDPDCMHAFGKCLESGFGIATDFESAVAWMKKAASLGQPDALAWCLRQGLPLGVASAE